jgi:hypothetical protein
MPAQSSKTRQRRFSERIQGIELYPYDLSLPVCRRRYSNYLTITDTKFRQYVKKNCLHKIQLHLGTKHLHMK